MHTSPVAHAPEDGLLPGPELDRLVAEALGVVPCDAWVPTSLGSAGGLAVMSDGCPHAHGACYPTVTHGPAGGLPPWSQPDGRYRYDRLTVDDLPPDHALLRQADGSYVVLALAANGRTTAGDVVVNGPHDGVRWRVTNDGAGTDLDFQVSTIRSPG